MNIYLIIGILLFSFFFVYLLKRTIRCFFTRGFVQKILETLLALLALMSLFFSLFAHILSQEHTSKDDNDRWFNLIYFINFPIEQLEKNSKEYTQEINNDIDSTKNDGINYIFVIDRTLSNTPNSTEEWVTEVKNKITQSVTTNLPNNPTACQDGRKDNNVTDLKEISDILLVGMMEHLYSRGNNSLSYTIMIYNGNLQYHTDDTKIFLDTINGFCNFLDSYTDSIKKVTNAAKRHTDFIDIFNSINEKSILNDSLRNVIIIFSDFLHEKKDWSMLENKIKSVYEKGGKNLIMKLFSIENNKNEQDKEKKNNIEITKTLITNYWPSIYLYEYQQGRFFSELKEEKNVDIFLNSVVNIAPPIDSGTMDTLIFYYPISFGKFPSTNKANIKFKNTETYALNIINESFIKEPIVMQLRNGKQCYILKNDYLDSYKIDTGTYNVNIQTQNMSDNFYLEMSNKTGKGRIAIKFRHRLPQSFCFIWIFASTLSVLLFYVLFVFFIMKLCYCFGKDSKNKYMKIISKLPIVFGTLCSILFMCYYGCLIYRAHKEFFYLWIIITPVIDTILIVLLCHENTYLEKKCNGCTDHS